jgi:hypothetical protein
VPPLVSSTEALADYLQSSPLGLLRVSLEASLQAPAARPFPPLPRKPRRLPPPPATLGSSSSPPPSRGARPLAGRLSEWPLAGRLAALVRALALEAPAHRFVVVRSPLTLRRRSVPDDGAAGCVLDERGGLATKNCQGDTRDTAYRLGLPLFTLDEGE